MTTGTKVRNQKQPLVRGVPKNIQPAKGPASPKTVAPVTQNLSTSYGVHVDRERQLAVFTDFWFAAVRHQILKGLSDNGLASVLGVSDKTVGNWRDCIVATSAIDDLIGLIDGLPKNLQSRNSQKVKASLQARLGALQKMLPTNAATRASGLPSVKTFTDAVRQATPEVLASLVMDLDARDSRLAGLKTASGRTRSTAQHLADELIDLYDVEEGLDLPMFRNELESRLAKVSQIAARLSLHQVLGMFDLFRDEDDAFAADLAVAVKEAKDEARSYVSKLFRRMEIENQFSERASFLVRLSAREPLYRPEAVCDLGDPFHPVNLVKAKKAQLKRLERLIDEHAKNTRVDRHPLKFGTGTNQP